jgi:hypothetical protein
VNTARRMTVDEIALMREIVRWRRNRWVDQWKASRAFGRFVQWTARGKNGKQVTVEFKAADDGAYAVMTIGTREDLGGIEIDNAYSFAQAIDALVAFGYLPSRFSSAYRAGWHAAQVWQIGEYGTSDEFKRLFHDPENISFPPGVDA